MLSVDTLNNKTSRQESCPDLLADEIESVDICSSTQQPLIEDNNKHQPGTGQEKVTHCEQEQHSIHHLRRPERKTKRT